VRRFHPLALVVLLVAANPFFAAATADTKKPASVIAVQVAGSVSVAHGESAKPEPVKDNDALAGGDIVETAPQSSVVLVLPNGSTVSLKEKSRLAITLVLQSPFAAPDLVVYDNTTVEPSTSSTSLELMFGELVASIRKLLSGSNLSIKTPAGQAAVKGTEFEVAYNEDAAGEANYRLSTASGSVMFSPIEGKPVEAGANRQIEVRGRVRKTGLKLQPVQARSLPVEVRTRIQKQNQAAGKVVKRALQQVKEKRNEAAVNHPDTPVNKPVTRPTPTKPAENPAPHPAAPVPPSRTTPTTPKRPTPERG
jgi:hypothetical protein